MANTVHKIFVDKMGGRNVSEFIGSKGDAFFDPDVGSIRVSDGVTPGGKVSSSSSSTVYFKTPANLRKWQSAIAKLRAGVYRPRVVFIGDSKTVGSGAGTSSGNTWTDGAEPRSKIASFCTQLAARGVPTNRNAWFASSGLASPAAKIAYDARLSGFSGWTGSAQTLGGVSWASGNTTPATFAPSGSIDRIEVYHRLRTADGQGSVTIDANASVLATMNVGWGGAESVGKATANVTLGVHTVNAQRTGGSFFILFGMLTYDSTTPAVDVISAGAFGTTSAYHASTNPSPVNASNALATVLPDLTIIQLGSNDLSTSVPVATYYANIQDIITKAKATGSDVVLEVATFGSAGGYGTDVTREEYRQAIISLGALNNCMVVDHAARFGSWTLANSLGLMKDAIHETEAGYADEASALVDALLF